VYTTMSNKPTTIKDIQNQTLGVIRTQGSVTRLTDTSNRTLGTYNSQTNVTYSGGKAVGQGNQLLRIKI